MLTRWDVLRDPVVMAISRRDVKPDWALASGGASGGPLGLEPTRSRQQLDS